MICEACKRTISPAESYMADSKGRTYHRGFCPSGASEASRAAMSASTTGSASAAAELSESKCVSEPDKAQRPESKKAGDETGVDNSVVQLPVSGSVADIQQRIDAIKKQISEKPAHSLFTKGVVMDFVDLVQVIFDRWNDEQEKQAADAASDATCEPRSTLNADIRRAHEDSQQPER